MAPEMVTRADTARLFFRCSDPGDPVYSHMTLADAEYTAQLLRERQIQTDLGFADTAEFQALEAAAVRRPGEPPLHAVAEQIHAFSAGALGPGGIPVRADRRVDLSVHPPRVAGAAIGISSRFNPPAALSPQAEQLLKQKAARAAVITALLPADDRAVRRLPAVNEDLWNAHMHGNMDIGPDSDAEGSVKAPPPRTRTPTSRSGRIAVS